MLAPGPSPDGSVWVMSFLSMSVSSEAELARGLPSPRQAGYLMTWAQNRPQRQTSVRHPKSEIEKSALTYKQGLLARGSRRMQIKKKGAKGGRKERQVTVRAHIVHAEVQDKRPIRRQDQVRVLGTDDGAKRVVDGGGEEGGRWREVRGLLNQRRWWHP